MAADAAHTARRRTGADPLASAALGELLAARGAALSISAAGGDTTTHALVRIGVVVSLAKADGTYGRVLAWLARYDVLILDDLGTGGLLDGQRHDLLELVEDRYERSSTILAIMWNQISRVGSRISPGNSGFRSVRQYEAGLRCE